MSFVVVSSRDDQQEAEAEQLAVGEALSVVLGFDQGAHEVIAALLTALGHELVEVHEQVRRTVDAGRRDARIAGLAVQHRVGPSAELVLVASGDIEHPRDHGHGQDGREVPDGIARPSRRDAVGELAGERPARAFERGNPPGCEGAAHKPAQLRVSGRVHLDDHRLGRVRRGLEGDAL